MKTRYIILPLILLIYTASLKLTAQTQQAQITGSWILNYQATLQKVSPTGKAHLDTIPSAQRTKIENIYKGRKMIFHADGRFKQILANGQSVEGSWSINTHGDKLHITDPNGRKHTQTIISLTPNTLALQPENAIERKLIMPELHYTKQ